MVCDREVDREYIGYSQSLPLWSSKFSLSRSVFESFTIMYAHAASCSDQIFKAKYMEKRESILRAKFLLTVRKGQIPALLSGQMRRQ